MSIARNIILVSVLLAALPAGPARAGELSRIKQMALLNDAEQAVQHASDTRDARDAEAYQRKAIAAFEGLIDGGVRNGKLYYNLGNAHFRINDLSRAILNYRRALRLAPGNSRIRENLKYARSKVHDRIETSGKRALARSLFFWHFDTSVKGRTTAAIVCYVIVWVALIIYVFLRRPPLRWLIVAAILLTIALGISCAADHYSRGRRLEGVVTAEEVELRKGNGLSYEPMYSAPLHSGAEFSVIERRGNWYHIRLNDGKSGWIQSAAAEII